jgi:hypothetical protein
MEGMLAQSDSLSYHVGTNGSQLRRTSVLFYNHHVLLAVAGPHCFRPSTQQIFNFYTQYSLVVGLDYRWLDQLT